MSRTYPRRQIVRRTGAVFTGFAAIVILSVGTDAVLYATGIYPPWSERLSNALFVLATLYRVVYTVAGCYLAARLAPDRPMEHAFVTRHRGPCLEHRGGIVA